MPHHFNGRLHNFGLIQSMKIQTATLYSIVDNTTGKYSAHAVGFIKMVSLIYMEGG